MKLSVESDALVMPSSSGSSVGRLAALSTTRSFSSSKTLPVDLLARAGTRCRPRPMRTFTHGHLADDDLDVLVVDLDALEPVDLLDLVDQVSQLLLAHERPGCRAGSTEPSISGSPAWTTSPSGRYVLALGNQVLASVVADPRPSTVDLALALGVLAERTTLPSISEMTARSLGLRASKSSATRGRPPVMSLVLVVSRGILASTSPALTPRLPSRDDEVRADRRAGSGRSASWPFAATRD